MYNIVHLNLQIKYIKCIMKLDKLQKESSDINEYRTIDCKKR